jgi:hypothetical protein
VLIPISFITSMVQGWIFPARHPKMTLGSQRHTAFFKPDSRSEQAVEPQGTFRAGKREKPPSDPSPDCALIHLTDRNTFSEKWLP